MSLGPGTRLGPYEIVAPLGAGGMGEVYKAKDTRLDRTVAVKVLPSHVSSDPTLRERFEREARTIAALNHPHICTLHDVGRHDGTDFLVLEYLEGQTLADRLVKGALPLDQALQLAIQIADGLDKAHRAGVVHRDLKPGNIMLTKSGAKLLDFGLAKPAAPLASLATMTVSKAHSPVTQEGMIVGTFQYMSPEQVEGKELDGRSDIFSLGAVLYEMLTGKKAFEGKSQLSVASAILEKEPPPISSLKPLTPASFDHAIRRCLMKEPERRWQSAADGCGELELIAETGTRGALAPAVADKHRERLLAVAAAAGVLMAILFAALYWRRPSEKARIVRSYIKAMPNSSFVLGPTQGGFAISPDGLRLAYVAQDVDGKALLWVRSLDSLEAQALAGTEEASFPFWSPDGHYIGFFASGKLKKIESSGGPP